MISNGLECTVVHRGIADIHLVKSNCINYGVLSNAPALSHCLKMRALIVETGSMRISQWITSRHLFAGDIFIPTRWRQYDAEITGDATFFIINFLDGCDAKQALSATMTFAECYIPRTFFAAPAIPHLTRQSYAQNLPEAHQKGPF
ncbi:hypothetical protein RX327_32525 [Bradyrhizobium sp. BEA-2-5]|uniref:hypothetical protein n=1 Tax=Bradyrhizobium sp. BEA-2-5 TaxID=3080015 RepID=UPI00293EFC9A|nr:hypothetical protein [Bradyrhizobium sp. BEA-2-5]WOH80461.1 hypothetical protein RX327_32525 [Bradyrhizobium sp. BEA-2-5]